ncbi:MAG: hypothetical protein LH472_12105 [Pyrinomonadaceae bacterium]|nr:hypothetical protein [Pyrinomonadaceae bacterium]
MEFEFDKEIDFLLRQTAQGETVFSGVNPDSRFQTPDSRHLDADEISAFAENALPEKFRQSYVWHLADCEKCRKNLSGLIALNAESQSEIVLADKSAAAEIVAPPIPWYRQFFAAPNLAYSMGALVLVFAGIAVFTVLQNVNRSTDSEVSQVAEKQFGGRGMASDDETMMQETYSNSMMSNTAMMSDMSANTAAGSSNSAMSSAPVMAANSNAMTTRRENNQISADDAKPEKSLSAPNKPTELQDSAVAGAPPPQPTPSNFQLDGEAAKQPERSQNSATQNQKAQNQTQITPDTRNVQLAPLPAAKMQKRSDSTKLEAKKKDAEEDSAETTSVGGKNFRRAGNIWIDAAYRGQTTTNISRGTKEYKKLDANLRGIAENLGGTVIIVWKEKSYRIQ